MNESFNVEKVFELIKERLEKKIRKLRNFFKIPSSKKGIFSFDYSLKNSIKITLPCKAFLRP